MTPTSETPEDLRASAAGVVAEAVRFAEESPWPEPEEALDDVWSESGAE
ncbi:hypothetical protein [Imhoffiella purpurea]|nr:hypothetical protein [Imhoffiella purpurea]